MRSSSSVRTLRCVRAHSRCPVRYKVLVRDTKASASIDHTSSTLLVDLLLGTSCTPDPLAYPCCRMVFLLGAYCPLDLAPFMYGTCCISFPYPLFLFLVRLLLLTLSIPLSPSYALLLVLTLSKSSYPIFLPSIVSIFNLATSLLLAPPFCTLSEYMNLRHLPG